MCCEPKDTTRPESDVPQWAKDAAREIWGSIIYAQQSVHPGGFALAPDIARIIARHARQAKEADRG